MINIYLSSNIEANRNISRLSHGLDLLLFGFKIDWRQNERNSFILATGSMLVLNLFDDRKI